MEPPSRPLVNSMSTLSLDEQQNNPMSLPNIVDTSK